MTSRLRRRLVDGPLTRHLVLGAALVLGVVAVAVGGLTAAIGRGAADDRLDQRAAAVRAVFQASLNRTPGDRPAALDAARAAGRPLGAAVTLLRQGPEPRSSDPPGRSYRYPLGGRRGSLVVTLPSTELADATRTGLIAGLGAGLTAAGLFFLLGRMWGRSIILPLRALRGTMATAAAGDYRQLRWHRGPPEVRETGEELDRLLEAVAAREAALEQEAASDGLTSAASRRRFHEALEIEFERAQRERGNMAVVKLDLDGFRQFNEDHGTGAGDEALRTMAEALKQDLRGTDLVARIGADHFGLVLPGTDPEVALAVTDRARRAVEAAMAASGAVSCSAGFACYPADACDTATLLQAADGALAWAKRSGGGQTRRYDSDSVVLSATEEQRAEVLDLLSRQDSIQPVYQPIVKLATGDLCGYEGLSRFPVVAERSPAAWFAQAHRCGLGTRLEAHALRAVLEHPSRPTGTFLSVNLSPSSLGSEEVEAVLPERLDGVVVEITEQERVIEESVLKERLDALRARGARIAVDDAGAGYAGLSQVMRIEPDIIKLDHTLVDGVHADPARAALIDSFVRFARRTGAAVCAEGIERLDELRTLADLDVTYGQGYALARPAAPWAPVAMEVVGPLLRRSLRTGTALSSDPEVGDSGERRLEQVVERLSEITSVSGLEAGLKLIATELEADEAALLRYDAARGELEALSHHSWLRSGECMNVASYRTTADVLATREVVQVMFSDGAAELGELALLGTTGHRALMVAPVASRGETLGVLMVFAAAERPWSRSEANRARILAYQLGSVVDTLAPPGSATVAG